MPDAPESGRFDGQAHRLPVRVYYEDTDFSGVVYHARYLHFLERGRTEFLRAAGLGHAELWDRDEALAFAVRRMEIDFARAARIDDALTVSTWFRELKGARLHIEQEIARGDEPVLAAKVEVVCLSGDGRPRRAPPELVAAVGPRLTPSAS
jgi:acyl-CoA thioester hydrolase